MRAVRIIVAALLLAGCGAKLAGTDPDASAVDRVDAPPIVDDAPPSIDAPPPPPCVEGEMNMTTASGCFASFTTTTYTRADAQAKCTALGMHLAYAKSAADEATIAALANGHDVAIGLSDSANEGAFVWDDGTPLGAYTDWHTGEPNDGNGAYAEDCVIYAGARAGGQWDDRPCAPPPTNSGVYGVICQR